MKHTHATRAAVLLAALLGVAAGGAGMYWFGLRHPGGGAAASHAAAPDGPARKPLYWHDPMVPNQRFDRPGKSPFMDMPLVPVYADGAGGGADSVAVSPRVQQNLGVRTAEVVRGRLATSLAAVGSVAYNERDLVLVQARSNGFVEKLHVRAPLDPIGKGQPLADLYVPDWIAAQEEYLSARRLQGAGLDGIVAAARERMRLAGMGEAQIRLVESSGKVHPRVTLTAPRAGVVTELAAREGMAVTAGAPLFRINGLSTVWIHAEIPESAAAHIRPGTAVEARAVAVPGTVFKGKVSAILPELNPATRTLRARIELGNPSGQLLPGMFATLAFAPARASDTLLVPTEAVIRTGARSVVIVALGGSRFQPVEVETGDEAHGQTEVRKGLEAGQQVLVSGQFLIDSEASLKGVLARMGDTATGGGTAAAPAVHHGEGKVERIGDGEVTISHGPVPSLHWGAMTMAFRNPPAGLPRGLAVGAAVSFDFTQRGDGSFELAAIRPAAAKADQHAGHAMEGMESPPAAAGAAR